MSNIFNYKIEKVKDVPLWHLDLSDLKSYYPDFKEWLKYSAFEKQCVSVYDKDNNLVAYAIFSKKENCKYIDNDNVYKISSIFVDPKFRLHSIGTNMIERIIELTHPDVLYLTVHRTNDEIMKDFLNKNGFILSKHYKERTNEYVYMKILNSSLKENFDGKN